MSKKTLSAALVLLTTLIGAITVTVTLATQDGKPQVEVVFGRHLAPAGQDAYKEIRADAQTPAAHTDLGSPVLETPPQGTIEALEAAKLIQANQKAAEATTLGPDHKLPLAAREPIDRSIILDRNYSSRRGARPALFVVHDTESPNVGGLQDVLAIAAWFNNPRAQASSNYTTDAEGNTIRLVPETAKAWTQAFFNPWSVSDELIGNANQRTWPEAQLRAAAKIAAASTARWGIPVRHGRVSGCTIVQAGILQHNDLGACGGGHHDAGPAFPITRFIALVADYRAGGLKPVNPPKPAKPLVTPKIPCPTTRPQVVAFQRSHRLDPDGIVGPLTRGALRRAGC